MSCQLRGLWKLPCLTVLWKTCRFAREAGLEDSATFAQVSHRTLNGSRRRTQKMVPEGPNDHPEPRRLDQKLRTIASDRYRPEQVITFTEIGTCR